MNLLDIILENFKNAETIFIEQGAYAPDVKEYVDKFKELKNKNIIKPPESDINYWVKLGWVEFRSFIIKYRNFKTNKEIKKDIKVKNTITTYEDMNVSVYIPLNANSSCLYGANTKWCVSARKNNAHYLYTSNYSFLLFFITKEYKPKKIAAIVSAKYGIPTVEEFRNSSDKIITERQFKNATHIDEILLSKIITKSYLEYMDYIVKHSIETGIIIQGNLLDVYFKRIKNGLLKNKNFNALYTLRMRQGRRIPELEEYLGKEGHCLNARAYIRVMNPRLDYIEDESWKKLNKYVEDNCNNDRH